MDAGTDIPNITTRAHGDGDHWVPIGRKMYITNGYTADYFVVLAKTDPDARAGSAMSMFIVKRGTEGFSNSPPLKKSGGWSGNYAKQRPLFIKNWWGKQVVQHKIASLRAEVEMARQFCYNTAWLFDQGEDVLKEVCMAKAHCDELANRVVSPCVQLHGSAGYIRETPVENMWRTVRLNSIGAGAPEIMWDQVARLL